MYVPLHVFVYVVTARSCPSGLLCVVLSDCRGEAELISRDVMQPTDGRSPRRIQKLEEAGGFWL